MGHIDILKFEILMQTCASLWQVWICCTDASYNPPQFSFGRSATYTLSLKPVAFNVEVNFIWVVDLLNDCYDSLLSLYVVSNPGMCMVLYRWKRLMPHLQNRIFFLHCRDSLQCGCHVTSCHYLSPWSHSWAAIDTIICKLYMIQFHILVN
jgi:hypothetical protein